MPGPTAAPRVAKDRTARPAAPRSTESRATDHAASVRPNAHRFSATSIHAPGSNAAPIQLKGKSASWQRRRRARLAAEAETRARVLPPERPRLPFRPSDLRAGRQHLEQVDSAIPHHEFPHIVVKRQDQPAHQFADFLAETRRGIHALDSGAAGYEHDDQKAVPPESKGRQLLSGINEGPHPHLLDPDRARVQIQDARLAAKPGNRATSETFFKSRRTIAPNSEKGFGAPSLVHYNPDIVTSDGHRPAFLGLGHELVHSLRNQRGEAVDSDMHDGIGRWREELETVGLVDSPTGISENDLRAEHGVPDRASYSGMSEPDYRDMVVKWLAKQRAALDAKK